MFFLIRATIAAAVITLLFAVGPSVERMAISVAEGLELIQGNGAQTLCSSFTPVSQPYSLALWCGSGWIRGVV